MISQAALQNASMIFVFISLLFAFFLLTVKSENRLGNIFLGLFFLIEAIDASSFFYHQYIEVPDFLDKLRFLIGAYLDDPLLYLFVLSVIYSDFKLTRKHLLHLIPLVLGIILSYDVLWVHLPFSQKGIFIILDERESSIHTWLAVIQRIFYLILIFYTLFTYRKVLLQNYSFSDKSNYHWLLQLNLAWGLIFIFSTIKNIYKIGENPEFLTTYKFVVIIVLIIFTSWLLLKALYAPRIFQGIASGLQLLSHSPFSHGTSTPFSINHPDAEVQKNMDRLHEHMMQQEPFLDPKLSIDSLALQLDMKSRDLSVLINQHMGKNFYEFVNFYRIQKAQKILEDQANKDLTILEILYEVGFHTKSSFNTSFKKVTGLTPTMYRHKHL